MITFATSGGRDCASNVKDFLVQTHQPRDPVPDHEQKRVALGYLNEAWAEAKLDGIDADCLAQACLFAAFAEFVNTYGEEAAASFADGLGPRIRNGEFTIERARQ